MALVDWEAVVLDLTAHVRSKKSHGQRELTDLLMDLAVKHRQPEGLPEKALRLYGSELADVLSDAPAARWADGPDGHGDEAQPLVVTNKSREEHHVQHHPV